MDAHPKRLGRRAVERILDLADERRRLDERTSPATKIAQRALFLEYRRRIGAGEPLPSVWETGFRVFSQFDEDGVVLFLLGVAGLGTCRFVDLGAGDGTTASNCANLALNLGFDGLFVDARWREVDRGRRFYSAHPDTRERPPVFFEAFLTRDNVDELLTTAGIEGDIDLLSIDVDGNDYWLWEAVSCVSPRFVVVETHTELGLDDYVMPYDPAFDWRKAAPGTKIGASPAAMTKLAERLGYRLVGANSYGFNAFYARHDVAALLPEIAVDELFRHRSGTGRPATGP